MKKKEGFFGQRSIVLPEYVIGELQHDIITSDLYITDIGFYPKAKHHYRQRESGCGQHILLYCTQGIGWVEIEGRKIKLKEDHVMVIPGKTPHQYKADEANPWSIYWFHFNGRKSLYFSNRLQNPLYLEPNSKSRNEDRIALFEQIYNTLAMGYGIENLYFACTSFQYFLVSILFPNCYSQSNHQRATTNDVVNQCIHYMKENIEKKLTLTHLAQQFQYSTSRISALFKSKTGYSPIDYFIGLKIQKACQYLDHSPMSISQISIKLGMDDPLYFSRIFGRKMGMSPSEYRKMEKG